MTHFSTAYSNREKKNNSVRCSKFSLYGGSRFHFIFSILYHFFGSFLSVCRDLKGVDEVFCFEKKKKNVYFRVFISHTVYLPKSVAEILLAATDLLVRLILTLIHGKRTRTFAYTP